MSWLSKVRSRLRGAGERTQKALILVLILGLALPGVVLLGTSFTQDLAHVDSATLSDTLPLGQTTILLDWPDHSYVELNWTNPVCGVVFTFLTPLGMEAWQNGGSLGDPTLTCNASTALFPGSAAYVVGTNSVANGTNYSIRYDLFRVTEPLAWLALPALCMLFAATAVVFTRLLGGAMIREKDHFASEQERKRR